MQAACESPSERFEPHLLIPWGAQPSETPIPPFLGSSRLLPPKGGVERRGSPRRYAFPSCVTWARAASIAVTGARVMKSMNFVDAPFWAGCELY